VRLQVELNGLSFLELAEQYEEALAFVRRILSQEDVDTELRRRLENKESRFLLQLGKVDEAISRFDERISAAEQAGNQDQKSWLLQWKTQLMLSTDRLEETIAVARASRAAAPHGSDDWITATFITALKLRQAGRFDEALPLSMEQYAADPQGFVMSEIAECHLELGAFGDAAEWLTKAEEEAARLRKSPRVHDVRLAERLAERVASLWDKVPEEE
jgi:tetratricopeptide (TPR) repeat protein